MAAKVSKVCQTPKCFLKKGRNLHDGSLRAGGKENGDKPLPDVPVSVVKEAGYRYLYLIYKEKGVHLTNRMNSSV